MHLSKGAIVAGITTLLAIGTMAPLIAAPDLDVAYISRTPRYKKYITKDLAKLDPKDEENPKQLLDQDEKTKRWPDKGELLTFTAVVKNPGDAPTGAADYKWYFDGKEVASGKIESINPGGQATATYKWKWDSEQNAHLIKFVVDPDNKIKEDNETNNTREDQTNALSFRIHCWQSVYDWFYTTLKTQNPSLGSFDDWAQAQVGYINMMFKDAVFPEAPNGILERARLDEIVVEPNNAVDQDPEACHAPTNIEWDCRWGFTPKEYPQIFIDHPEFIKGPYTWVMHEWGHQMGIIDIYQLYLGRELNHVQPYGHQVTRASDLMTSTAKPIYSDWTATVFNANLHKRRGYFGDYLYDLPQTCRVRVLDAYGKPIPNATVKFYQDHAHQVNSPEDFTGTTDAQGVYTMPNRDCYGSFTTATGHTLHDNPWGMIHVVGFNGLFFCDVRANGQSDYQYIEILPFNLAYRAGHKDTWTYDLQTTIAPGGKVTNEDLFGVKMTSATNGFAVGAGGTILKWDGTKWAKMQSPTGQALLAVDAAGDTACAVGGHGTVVIYSNGALSMKSIKDNPSFYACAMASPTTIIVGGAGGELDRSTDGGNTWTKLEITGNPIKSIRFADANSGIMVCEGGKVYYTTDGGATWVEGKGDIANLNITDCCMASPTEAWFSVDKNYARNDKSAIYKSTDGGKTWVPSNDFGWAEPMNTVEMKAGGNGWCAGTINKFYNDVPIKRFENGKFRNEYVMTYGANDTVYDISCLTGSDAWLVGKGGLILHLKSNDF